MDHWPATANVLDLIALAFPPCLGTVAAHL